MEAKRLLEDKQTTRASQWWADPTAALVIAALALEEGRESWRGEGCGDAC